MAGFNGINYVIIFTSKNGDLMGNYPDHLYLVNHYD